MPEQLKDEYYKAVKSEAGNVTFEKLCLEFQRVNRSPLYKALIEHLGTYRGILEEAPRSGPQRSDL